MCSPSCIIFAAKSLAKEDVAGKAVLEVGAYDENGSLRPLLDAWKPAKCVGVDIVPGPCVDVVCDAADLVRVFGENSFDLVVSTELIEHVRDWRSAISSMKRVCRPGGSVLVTTRSPGYPYHGYPDDFWRFELDDFREIFSDFEIAALESDYRVPGAFVMARKPAAFRERDLRGHELYSMCTGKRQAEVSDKDMRNPGYLRLKRKDRLRKLFYGWVHKIAAAASKRM